MVVEPGNEGTEDVARMSGATEMAASSPPGGKVQQYGRSASFPMIINRTERPRTSAALKDRAGLIKSSAFRLRIQLCECGD